MHSDFAETNAKSFTQHAATCIQYRCSFGHNFTHSVHFSSKLGICSAYRLDYIDKKYSTCKTLMCGAMKPVSLLFDQPTYIYAHFSLLDIRSYKEVKMSRAQAESVIKNIIREIAQECASKGQAVSETLVAFMVNLMIFLSIFNINENQDCHISNGERSN